MSIKDEELKYLGMSKFSKIMHDLAKYFVNLPSRIGRGFVSMCKAIWHFICAIGLFFKGLWNKFTDGSYKTRLSFLFMGSGCLLNGQIIRGLAYLASQVFFVVYMIFFGAGYLAKFGTLGTVETTVEVSSIDPILGEIYTTIWGDNSLKILLFSVMSLMLAVIFVYLYVKNIENAYANDLKVRNQLKPDGFSKDLNDLLDKNFHVTLLSFPMIGILIFTVLPLIFMILIAFTNYDKSHLAPAQLFTWVGFDNISELLFGAGIGSTTIVSFASTFWSILQWTMIWAILATLTTYVGGIILALMINRKGIKGKKIYRGMFVMTIAIPQFVSLLVIAKFFDEYTGLVNQLLTNIGFYNPDAFYMSWFKAWGWLGDNGATISWLGKKNIARISVVVINMWIGLPYTMLSMSGILMNIPEDMYEAARIDGASSAKMFFSITLPYMLNVTGPYLLTQFIGNINNFNVIYLLTGGGPVNSAELVAPAGETDLLITWLFNITMGDNQNNYKMGSAIGILVFVVCATLSLFMFAKMNAQGREETYQ